MQLSVRRGTASKDGACSTGIMGQLGLQRTAAGCSAWLGFSVQYIVGRWRKRLLRLLARRRRSCAWVKQVGEVGLRRWLDIDGDLGTWGNIAHHLDGNKENETLAWSTMTGVARPLRVVILRGDESEVQRRKWRGPRVLCYRGGDCEVAYERSGFGGITPSGEGWCCSGTAAEGLAWRWSSRCSAVYILRFPIDAG